MVAQTLLVFIVVAILAAIGLWTLAQWPNLDQTIVKLIRIAVYVALAVLLLNLILVALLHKTVWQVLGATG